MFMRLARGRALETVADTRRALDDTLPSSSSRPSLTAAHFRRAVAAKAPRSSSARRDAASAPSSPSASPQRTTRAERAVAAVSFEATTPPASTSGRSALHRSPDAPGRSTRASPRAPARPSPPTAPPNSGGFSRALEVPPTTSRVSANAAGSRTLEPLTDGDVTAFAVNLLDARPETTAETFALEARRRSAREPKRTTLKKTRKPSVCVSSASNSNSNSNSNSDSDEAPIGRAPVRDADENVRAFAEMASMAKARARAAGLGRYGRESGFPGKGPTQTRSDPDDALVSSLRALLRRLTRRTATFGTTPNARPDLFGLFRDNRIDELLWNVEHAAARLVQARWRGFRVREWEFPRVRKAVLLRYRPSLAARAKKGLGFWRSWTRTRRKLRIRARSLRLKYGARAHYYVGRRTTDSVDDEGAAGGSCDAWTFFEAFGAAGVAGRWRRWRFLAYAFCRWRAKAVFA